MIATLRTSRLLPALLAATLLLGAGLPLVQYACAMSGDQAMASPLASPFGSQPSTAFSGQGHDRTSAVPCEHGPACEHLPASALGVLCNEAAAADETVVSDGADAAYQAAQAAADCTRLSAEDCYEATIVQADEAHDLSLRTTVLAALPLAGYLSLPSAGDTAAGLAAASPEDASPPEVPARLRFAVLLL